MGHPRLLLLTVEVTVDCNLVESLRNSVLEKHFGETLRTKMLQDQFFAVRKPQ